MSYGNISILLDKTKTYIETKNINNLDANELQLLKNKVYKHLKRKMKMFHLLLLMKFSIDFLLEIIIIIICYNLKME